MNTNSSTSTLGIGRQLLSSMNPDMQKTRKQRYGQYLPGLNNVADSEIICQVSLYGGFPAAINALNVALDAFTDYGELESTAHS